MTSPLPTPQELNPENATDEELRVALTLWGRIGSISGLGNREWLAIARAAIAAMDGGWRIGPGGRLAADLRMSQTVSQGLNHHDA